MIEIHYFASIRERLGMEQESISAGPATVSALTETLVSLHGDPWRQVLLETRVLTAVNHVVSGPQTPLKDGDEVAFFPPVTGG